MICMEIDGTRVVHTGDQAFFEVEGGVGYQAGARMFTNHVYKNGLDLGCYKRFLEDLRRFEPELVITGHTRPYRTSPEWYAEIGRAAEAFDDVHTTLMLLADDDAHFGAESQGGKLVPIGPTRPRADRSNSPAGCSTPTPRSSRPASGCWDPMAGKARR